MNVPGIGRIAAIALSCLLVSSSLEGKDVYKGSLDSDIPRHRAVLDILEKLKASPNDAGLKNDLGCLIAQEGFWRDALREFDEAAALDKKSSTPYFNAGLVKATKGEWSGAKSYFGKATDRDPGNWRAWWMLGFAHEQLGQTERAVEAYKVSLRVDTSLFDVNVNPYAAWTQLKGRALLETYEKRKTLVTLHRAEQFSDPDRAASSFRKSKAPAAPAATPASPAPAPVVAEQQGPIVAKVPPPAGSAGPGKKVEGPAWNPSVQPREPRLMRVESAESTPTTTTTTTTMAPPSQENVPPPGPGIGGMRGPGGPGIGGMPPPAPSPAPGTQQQ